MAMSTIVERATTDRVTPSPRRGRPRPAGPSRPALSVGSWTDPSARSRLALIELAHLRSGRPRPVPVSVTDELGQVVPPVVDVARFVRSAARSRVGTNEPMAPPLLRSRSLVIPPHRAPSALRRPARAGRVSRIRLTVLGQVAVVAALALIVISAALFANLSRSQAAPPRDGGAQVSVSVAPGDTLYSLAARWAPGADPAEVVRAILVANDMTAADAAALQPGQKVLVPVP